MDNFSLQLPDQVLDVALRIGLALLAFALVWLLRRGLVWLTAKILRVLAQRTNGQWDETFRNIVDQPVRWLTMALAIHVATQVLALQPGADTFVYRLTRSLVIIAIALGVANAINIFAFSRSRLFSFTGVLVEERLLPFVRTGLQLVLFAIVIVIIIQVWGYDVSGLVAGLGLGGLAFSLAAQDTLSNLFGFSTIVGDRPFVVGEFIKTPDVEGIVERVGLRSTRVRRLDQSLVTVPNSTIANSAILNWSRLSKRWIDYTIGVSYDASPEELETLMKRIREMLASREAVDPDSIVVHFVEFGDNALNILIRAYVNKAAWLEFTQEKEAVNLEVMRIMRDLGLSFAFPSRSIYIEKFPNLAHDRPQPHTHAESASSDGQ